MHGTVKQFKDMIEEMRTVYMFKDEKTQLSTFDHLSRQNNRLQLFTVDERTGVSIVMEKYVPRSGDCLTEK